MKQNLILRSAILAGFGVAANAGQIGVASLTTYGAETMSATSAIKMPTVSYQTAVPINANAKFYVYVHVDNGATLNTNVTIPSVGASAANGLTFTAASNLGTDTSTLVFEASAGSSGVPSGALINLSENGANSDLGSLSALAAGGAGVVDVTWSMSNLSDFNGSTVPAADVDSASTAPLVKSTASVVGSIISSANFASSGAVGAVAVNESVVIDLAGSAATKLIGNQNITAAAGTTTVNLGAVTYTVNTNLSDAVDSTSMQTSDFGQPTVTVTGDFTPKGTVEWIDNSPTCSSATYNALTPSSTKTSASGAATGFTLATAAAGANGTYATGTIFVCAKYSGTATINPYQSTIASTLPSLAGHSLSATTVAAANAYNLKNNGASVLLHSYLPNGLAKAAGIQSFVRVVNTSSTSAAVSVAVYDDAAGTLGTAAVLGTIAPHASTTFTSAQVEAAAGTIANSNVHSLLLTAPTSNLAAQTLLIGAGGVVADTTAVATYNNVANGESNQ